MQAVLLLSLLFALKPDGFRLGLSYGMPGGTAGEVLKSGSSIELGLFMGEDRRIGLNSQLVRITGLDERYVLRFFGLGPEIGLTFNRISLTSSVKFGRFERQFDEGREAGSSLEFYISGSLKVLSGNGTSAYVGLDLSALPSSKRPLVVYGLKIELVGRPWD